MEFRSELKNIKDTIDRNSNENTNHEQEQLNSEYQREKAKAEAHETSLIVQDPTKALHTKLNLKVAEHIDKSPEVAEKISNTADKLVDKGLKTQENKATAQEILSQDETMEADFQKYKDEYLYHGVDHKIDAKWKRNLLLRINDVWFVIWAIVSCFTIVPVSTFLSRITALKGIVKGVAIVLGILLLLACLGGVTFEVLKACGVFG